VYEVLRKGSEVARAAAADTLAAVKRAMRINYFDPDVLGKLIDEQTGKYKNQS
jgi:tryptophanyl-tRNA synthetase